MIMKFVHSTPICQNRIRKTLLVFLFFAISLVQAGPYMDQGNALYRKGQYSQAYFNYKKALEKGDNAAMARFNMANCLYQMKQVGRALVMYEKIIAEHPDFIRAYVNAGGVYFQMHEVGEALNMYMKAHERDPENTSVLRMLGESFLKIGDRASALNYLEKGMRLEPENTAWIFAMVDVYLGIEDFAAAADLLKEAVSKQPERADLHSYLGDLYTVLEKPEQAALSYGTALENDDENASLYFRLAGVQERQNNDFLAILTLKEGIRKQVLGNDARLELGRLYFKSGDFSRALDAYLEAARNESPDAREGVVAVLQQLVLQNRDRQLKEYVPQVNELYSADPEVRDVLSGWKQS